MGFRGHAEFLPPIADDVAKPSTMGAFSGLVRTSGNLVIERARTALPAFTRLPERLDKALAFTRHLHTKPPAFSSGPNIICV